MGDPTSAPAPFELRLETQVLPLCPELRLRLLSPCVDLDADAREVLAESAPFWAFCWASGQVLARWVLDHPDLVRGRRVVDLGAGSGVVAIAAAGVGAKTVVACDSDPAALHACRENAALNDVRIECAPEADSVIPGCDVLLASDVLYESETTESLVQAARRLQIVLIADPGRRKLTLQGLETLWECEARTVPEIDETTPGATVYRVSY